jgi:uncharacterized membrane protein
MLARLLVGAAVAWPLIAGAALWQRLSSPTEPLWSSLVYAAAGRVCHQRPERSFHTHNVKWPVCARCSGLYVAAPFAAFLVFRRREIDRIRRHAMWIVALAAVPTALTLMWEWGGAGTPSNWWRFGTALPLGAAVAAVLIATVREPRPAESIR